MGAACCCTAELLEVFCRHALDDWLAIGLGVSNLPLFPRPVKPVKVFPQVVCLRISLCGEHGPRHVYDEGSVVDWHLCALGLFLRIFECFSVLWDCLPLVMHLVHFILEDKDVDLVVSETHFLDLVHHRLGGYVKELRWEPFREFRQPDMINYLEDEAADFAFGHVVDHPVGL